MRIVAYTNLYMPSDRAGAQTTLRDLLRPLKDRHDISIVTVDGLGLTEPYAWEGIPVFPDATRPDVQEMMRSSDLLITHLAGTLPATSIGSQHNIPVVQLLHSNWPGDTGEHGFLRRRCNLAVFNSRWLSKEFPEYRGPGMVVHPLVDPQEYRTQPGGAVTLVNVSDFKGSKIFYALAEKFPHVQFHGVLGYGDQDIRELPNVSIGQSVDDMRTVYGRTRILLMPSEAESFGRCAVEAAASGIPTIAAPTLGLQEALGEAGIYCRLDDVASWKEELARLLRPNEWEKASARALARSAALADLTGAQAKQWCQAIDAFEVARS